MGWYMSLMVGALEREGDQFVQHNSLLRFTDEVYIAWCRPARGPLLQGWKTEANGTLRVRYQTGQVADQVTFETDPVSPAAEPGLFGYAEQFDMGDISGLYHLVLPPRHLPQLATVQPFPTYARSQQERFILGWIWRPGVWFRFTFGESSASNFEQEANRLRKSVVDGQAAALEYEEDLSSIETLLRMWQGNLRFLEQQAARYGLDMPLRLHNELEDARAQIAALERRKSGRLAR